MSTLVSEWMAEPSAWANAQDYNAQPLRYLASAIHNRRTRSTNVWHELALERQLQEISRLRQGWDGCDAEGISELVASNAKFLLGELAAFLLPPNFLLPTAAGTIAFDWESSFGSAHLEIGETTFGFYTEPNVGESIMQGGPIKDLNIDDLRAAIQTITITAVPNSLETRIAVGF